MESSSQKDLILKKIVRGQPYHPHFRNRKLSLMTTQDVEDQSLKSTKTPTPYLVCSYIMVSYSPLFGESYLVTIFPFSNRHLNSTNHGLD
jgi:hypothetical protein